MSTLAEMEDIRRRLAREGQERIDDWFESEAYRKEVLVQDRAQRAKARRALTMLEKKRQRQEWGRPKGKLASNLPQEG